MGKEQRKRKKVLLEGKRREAQEVVSDKKRIENVNNVWKNKKWTVAYTNINGLISTLRELNNYIKIKQPDIMGITEVKLNETTENTRIGNSNYNVWIKHRNNKKGGGVMLLTKKSITMEEVEIGEGMAEVIRIQTKKKEGRNFAVAYVPPKTNAWTQEDYKLLLRDTSNCLERILAESNNLTLMGDFNCKEVCWEEWTMDVGEESWGYMLLNLIMTNTMMQWIGENARFGSNEES